VIKLNQLPGTATNVPIKVDLSPALAVSTISFLNIISIDLGILPGGISLGFS
jgi:hypothetical protein